MEDYSKQLPPNLKADDHYYTRLSLQEILELIKSAFTCGNMSEAKRLASHLPDSDMGEYVKEVQQAKNL